MFFVISLLSPFGENKNEIDSSGIRTRIIQWTTSFWKMAWPFIWTSLNPLYLKVLFATFGWNWPSGSWEKEFLNFVNVFFLLCKFLSLEKGVALHLNKLEFPSPKNALCQVGWLIDCIGFNAVSAIYQPYNGGLVEIGLVVL